jgi:hypothetical protein
MKSLNQTLKQKSNPKMSPAENEGVQSKESKRRQNRANSKTYTQNQHQLAATCTTRTDQKTNQKAANNPKNNPREVVLHCNPSPQQHLKKQIAHQI